MMGIGTVHRLWVAMHEHQNLFFVRLALIGVGFEHKLAALKRDGKDCFDRPVRWQSHRR